MEFYKSVFGGKLDISTYKDFQASATDPSEDDKVMHAVLQTENRHAPHGGRHTEQNGLPRPPPASACL